MITIGIRRQHHRIEVDAIMLVSLIIASCGAPFVTGGAMGADTDVANWPQFRGPGGQGRAASVGLPIRWSESTNVAWKVAIPGEGHSSPVVLGNQIWLTTALADGKSLRAVCIDFQSGQLLHNVEVFSPGEPVPKDSRNSYATPTPAMKEDRVYVHFGTMGTACLDNETGEVLWRNQQFQIDHETGPAASPIVVNNLLIVNFDGMNEQFVVALDRQTGDVVWKTDRSQPYRDDPVLRRAFSTPLVINDGDYFQLVSVGADQTHAYDPLTGKEIWYVTYEGTSNIPYPLYGNGMIYLITGFRTPELWAVRPDGRGDVTNTHVQWKFKKAVSAVPSPILIDDRIFMVNETGICSCLDAGTGKPVWRSRFKGNFSASPVFSGGHVYFPGEEGTTIVVEKKPAPRIVANNTLAGRISASPAIADRSLLIRTHQHLYRIEKSD